VNSPALLPIPPEVLFVIRASSSPDANQVVAREVRLVSVHRYTLIAGAEATDLGDDGRWIVPGLYVPVGEIGFHMLPFKLPRVGSPS